MEVASGGDSSGYLHHANVEDTPATPDADETQLESFLGDLGLKQLYKEKLSLSRLLQIDKKTITGETAKCNSDLPWDFLKKLMMVNVTARNLSCTSPCTSNVDLARNTGLDLNLLLSSLKSGDMLNPLDIITALFLCSDGFVQQEMALKMSLCQFSVPLLLPSCDTKQCSLMLWALRGIIKKYRPQSLSESKGFTEERIVLSELPMISFVRLGQCSLSKSEILNKLLSNTQQYHDTFVHRNMKCGDIPRKASNGLAEVTWYLPCGNQNMDVFSEPVAIANLRGDMASFETQFSFLCQTSAAVFVFFDTLDSECKVLTNQHHKAQIFLVGNHQSNRFRADALIKVATKLGLTNTKILLKTREINDADFIQNLRKTVSNVVEKSTVNIRIEQMAETACELGIRVDEYTPECQRAKERADAITARIQNILNYKETQLPLQGQVWKELSRLEKEEFRLKKVGSQETKKYQNDLRVEKIQLREKQNSYDMSNAMTCFISAISSQGTERCYFLKWMQMNLDNVSRNKLSGLREQYKEKCQNPENKEIKDIDKELANSSLGTEHFFREMGQIYEASLSLHETDRRRQYLQHLPKLCAELLLDGFPLELVDGDASNIPLRWVSDVLFQLNELVSPKNKILVVTVLGVQSTGKSTLLNTMFGVQFAVSSGRCTRGAFMLLIKISEDLKEVLDCDFLVIIDTEGLKSPALAQLAHSYEHDNELATLVVGMSNVTIINMSMENSTEMKDILQIVVHAFLRMKEVSEEKPKCQFVHQNVSDVSAHENNSRDRELLLQQLDEMTQAAAKMEKREENKSFTDVMEYSPDTGNWYIPGLWNGNPPMAPVNAGYSENVYQLKKNIIQILGTCKSSANDIPKFTDWMKKLWTAVKHENFIFSFRNSLVADAYMRICTEFNKWEWKFKKQTYEWVTDAETKIANFGTSAGKSEESNIDTLFTDLKKEAQTVLPEWNKEILDNLTKYFEQTEGHVHLVEAYREDFVTSAKDLLKERQRSVSNQLTAAVDIRKGMREVDELKEKQTKVLEKRVYALIDKCQKEKREMTGKELDKEFDMMWKKMMKDLSFSKQEPTNIIDKVDLELRENLTRKGVNACELGKRSLKDCGLDPYTVQVDGFFKQVKHTLNLGNTRDHVAALQKMADGIILTCKQKVAEKTGKKNNYHDTYIQEILRKIDEKLQNNQEVKVGTEFEISLKQHICGFAARRFQKMHEDFIDENDPYECLAKSKEKFRADFKDVFNKRDQCQKKAEEFTSRCLRPAVEDYVNRFLGPDITEQMKEKKQFSTRANLQYEILLDLISKHECQKYLSYIRSYEDYVRKWILNQILEHWKKNQSTIEEKNVKLSISSINDAISEAKEKSGDLKTFVKDVCQKLVKLKFPQDALRDFMILNNADREKFADWLTRCVEDMAQDLRKEFKKTPIQTKLNNLPVKPEDDLFDELIGCGKQCPFCKAPCDAGGETHNEHWTKLHRPDGLSGYHWRSSEKLTTDICSSSVDSDVRFRCRESDEYHPYRQYRDKFPDWSITPDRSLEASDYWKYVMAKFNTEFAKAYNVHPADVPTAWTKISCEEAKASLKKSFGVK